MIVLIKYNVLFLIIIFISCDNNKHIQSYRTPKKDFGLSLQRSEPLNKENSKITTNLTWDLPRNWVPSSGHSMRLASFDVPFSNGVGDLSIVSLSGSSGGLLANVNRWRGQVDLNPISESDILTISTVGESKMGAFRIFRMINDSNTQNAIIAAVLPTGEKTFFIKLTASKDGIIELQTVFEKFCSSIGN